jgi:hypothetical protein
MKTDLMLQVVTVILVSMKITKYVNIVHTNVSDVTLLEIALNVLIKITDIHHHVIVKMDGLMLVSNNVTDVLINVKDVKTLLITV